VQAAALAIDDQQRSADVEGGGSAMSAPPPADEGVCEEAAQLVDSTPWLPAMLRQDSRRRLMGRQDSLALFQVHNCTAPTTAYLAVRQQLCCSILHCCGVLWCFVVYSLYKEPRQPQPPCCAASSALSGAGSAVSSGCRASSCLMLTPLMLTA
jgi:hypothetical protein